MDGTAILPGSSLSKDHPDRMGMASRASGAHELGVPDLI
jgi:hypothetical protein